MVAIIQILARGWLFWNRADSVVDVFGSVKTMRTSHGVVHRKTLTPATVAVPVCRVQRAIRATVSTSPRCPKATEAFSIGRVGDTDGLRSGESCYAELFLQPCSFLCWFNAATVRRSSALALLSVVTS